MQANTKAPRKPRAAQAPQAPQAPIAAPSPRAIAIAEHTQAGFTGANYAGISKPRNSGIAKPANTSTSKATPRTHAQLTPRMLATLSQLATAYGKASFPLCGIDRGQCAIFINSGFIIPVGAARGELSDDCLSRYGDPVRAAKPVNT